MVDIFFKLKQNTETTSSRIFENQPEIEISLLIFGIYASYRLASKFT